VRRISTVIALAAVIAAATAVAPPAHAQLKVVPHPLPNGGQGTGGAPNTWDQVIQQVLFAGCMVLVEVFGAECTPQGGGGTSGMDAELIGSAAGGSDRPNAHQVFVNTGPSGGPGGDGWAEFSVAGTTIRIDFAVPANHAIGPNDWSSISGTWGYDQDRCFHDPTLYCPPDDGGDGKGDGGGGGPPMPPVFDPPPPPPPPPPRGPAPGLLPVVEPPPPPPPPEYGGGGGDEPMCGPDDDYCVGAIGAPSYGMEDY